MPDTNDTFKLLIRKRGSVKLRLTLFNKYLTELFSKINPLEIGNGNIDKEIIIELECRYNKFTTIQVEYEEFQTQIETTCHEDELENHVQDRQLFENEYFKNLSKAKGILDNCLQSNEQTDSVSDRVNSSNSRDGSVREFLSSQFREVPVKLPLINLPNFNGTYTKWLEFKDTFESLINANNSIGDIQKFHYLRASLGGSAKQIIDSLEFSSANYSAAWELLCKRYDNKKILVRDHLSGIYEMEPLKHESSEGLRHILDTLNKHLRALENLGEPVQFWDSLLIYHITTKFDKSSLKEWEIFKIKTELPSLQDFKDFIRGKADLLETIENNSRSVKGPQISQKQKSFLAVNKSSKQNKNCIMCKASHNLDECKQFLDLPIYQRSVQIKRNKMCLCCFDKNHFSRDCPASKCSKCGLAHNVLLHYNRDSEKNSTAGNGVYEGQPKSSEYKAAVTLSSRTSSVKGQVLLSTAVVRIKDISGSWFNCTVLMDSGSMSNFISEKMCSKLKLSTESINVAVVGISQESTIISKRCNVDIQSVYDNFKFSLSCLVTSQITEELPSYEFGINCLQLPRDISLANPDFNRPQEIDMLIGASVFWNLIQGGQIKLGDGLPILQNSRLGWIVSGELGQGGKFEKTWCNLSSNQDVQDQLAKFWSSEEPTMDTGLEEMSVDERECERLFEANMNRAKDGRFMVGIPFKNPVTELGDKKNGVRSIVWVREETG